MSTQAYLLLLHKGCFDIHWHLANRLSKVIFRLLCVNSFCFLTTHDFFSPFGKLFRFLFWPIPLSTSQFFVNLTLSDVLVPSFVLTSNETGWSPFIQLYMSVPGVLTTQVSDGHGYSTTFISSAMPSKSTLPHVLLSTGIPFASKSAAQVKHLKTVSSNALMSWPLQLFWLQHKLQTRVPNASWHPWKRLQSIPTFAAQPLKKDSVASPSNSTWVRFACRGKRQK